ncbi:MAG: M56 family metallopeptidase [Oscillospiraceae bacterium]|nr:M56 family metallopeptidase [Oscillospiraceae bacterium]
MNMGTAFIKVLNMSISASWLVLAVLVLRLALKKSPRWISVALWALVAVRLICPVSIESPASLIPSRETIPETIVYAQTPAIDSGVEVIDQVVNDNVMESMTPQVGNSVNPVQVHLFVQENLWCLGMGVMLLWAMISYLRLKKKVAASIDVGNGIYICDYIATPFILGIVKPKIYLPSALEPDSASHVLAHERAHIARKDHWWKPFGYLLLTVHWFNPVLWLAYILLCRDIELACDEKVIRNMEAPQKKAYSEALLNCSVNRRMIAACPLAFGEVGVKERVKTVLNYKKPAFWLVLVAIVALIVTAICFLTDPVNKDNPAAGTYRVDEIVYRNPAISYYMTEEEAPLFQITGDNTLRIKEQDEVWKDLGKFSPITLSDLNLNTLFIGLEQGQPWMDSKETWMLALPPEETANGTKYYLLFRQENGTMYLGEGMAFTNVYPIHENILDATYSVTWVYRLTDADAVAQESPYPWTSTVKASDIQKAWAYPYEGAVYHNTIEGSLLDELITLFNGVQESEMIATKSSGEHDPIWNNVGTMVNLYCKDGMSVFLNYVEDAVIIGTETDSGTWEVDGYWVIENENLTNWLERIANGGTYMLSKENREEIRTLLRMEQVQYFAPREYGGLLFVGCAYDNGRGRGVAVYEPLADGYRLLKLIRDEEVKRCASGSEVYYCDYGDARIFLILNESITGMEWAGAYENAYSIDTHPGLVVEYFPENLDAMYRFHYGGGSTMYMDRNDKTYGQPPAYAADPFANPDDAYHICTNLKFSDVVCVWIGDSQQVDDGHARAIAKDATDHQRVQLINYLHGLPESAFEQAEYPTEGTRYLELYLEEPLIAPYVDLKLHEEEVYFRFCSDSVSNHQGWKIRSEELKTFLESFYVGDRSDWMWFDPHPVAEGEITFYSNGMEMTMPNYLCFQYEQADDGIRFKQKDHSGWVLLKIVPAPLEMDSNLKSMTGIHYGQEAQWAFRDFAQIWSYMNLTIPGENGDCYVLLLNEEEAAWVGDPESNTYTDIRWLLNNLEVGGTDE